MHPGPAGPLTCAAASSSLAWRMWARSDVPAASYRERAAAAAAATASGPPPCGPAMRARSSCAAWTAAATAERPGG